MRVWSPTADFKHEHAWSFLLVFIYIHSTWSIYMCINRCESTYVHDTVLRFCPRGNRCYSVSSVNLSILQLTRCSFADYNLLLPPSFSQSSTLLDNPVPCTSSDKGSASTVVSSQMFNWLGDHGSSPSGNLTISEVLKCSCWRQDWSKQPVSLHTNRDSTATCPSRLQPGIIHCTRCQLFSMSKLSSLENWSQECMKGKGLMIFKLH